MSAGSNILAAFSADQVVRLTGLTMRQLAYWDRTKFFQPQYASGDRRSPYSRVYSFEDVVGLRTISVLMNDHDVTMHHLRQVAERLSKYTARPWSEIKLMVWKRKVQWIEPDTGLPAGVVDGQYLMVHVADIIQDVRTALDKERVRDPADFGQIERRRFVVHNQATIAGTRITVAAIKRLAEDGYGVEQIIAEYPSLTEDDVRAAMNYRDDQKAA